MKLTDMQVESYLKLVASEAPAPGGGSASALCGAQGIGLIAMAARLTCGKKKYAHCHAVCKQAAEEADIVCSKLLRQIDNDTEAYGRIADAFKLPRETEREKEVRRQEISRAALYAAEVPFETMKLGLQGLECVQKLVGNYNVNCASDVGCGIYGLLSCVRGAWMNVLINLNSIPDTVEALELKKNSTETARRAEEIAEILEKEILKEI